MCPVHFVVLLFTYNLLEIVIITERLLVKRDSFFVIFLFHPLDLDVNHGTTSTITIADSIMEMEDSFNRKWMKTHFQGSVLQIHIGVATNRVHCSEFIGVATNSTRVLPIRSSGMATNSTCVTHEVLAGAVSKRLPSYHILWKLSSPRS